MKTYNWDEEKCKKLANGEIAVDYNNGDLEMLWALLKKLAPKDVAPEGVNRYYSIHRNKAEYWTSCDITSLPTIQLSDFIVKEEFVWTDELVVEAITKAIENATRIDANISAKLTIDDFKASKQRKYLFITEDGKSIFEGDEFWAVDTKEFRFCRLTASLASIIVKDFKCFSTEVAAKKYIMLNKPMYSLNDAYYAIWRIKGISKFKEDIGDLLIKELKKLKTCTTPTNT